MKKTIVMAAIAAFIFSSNTTVYAQGGLSNVLNGLSQDKVSQGLKEALNKGIEEQVSKLTKADGFLKNEMVKIMLPEEAQKVDKTLRNLGMGSIADQGIVLINRAAENAVKEATPIFVDAIKNMSFTDAKGILLGGDNAATTFLKKSTSKALQSKFAPVIQEQLSAIGADKAWEKIFSTYNNLPLVTAVNTNLTDYVTNQTMEGVFKMIAVEETNIRKNVGGARSNELLKDVFGKQDKVTNTENKQPEDNTSKNNNQKKSIFNIKKKKN
ncbi:MAG: DUF4197 domain-containing protein [Flavobacteriaceae bacterium]|jgi:hypothetical protein|nr:DUF4197 domain-containing protein [Flavobacteriaceae bacterium]